MVSIGVVALSSYPGQEKKAIPPGKIKLTYRVSSLNFPVVEIQFPGHDPDPNIFLYSPDPCIFPVRLPSDYQRDFFSSDTSQS
jgi:hypothetical protein